MAFPKRRPRRPEVPPLEALERREAQVQEVLEFLDGKKTLKSLGLTLDDLRAFAALRGVLGPEGLERLAPMLRAMDPGAARAMPDLLSLGLRADEAAALREMARVLKGAGVSWDSMAPYQEAAAGLARLGFGAEVVKAVGKEVERLRRAGIPPERAAALLAAYAEQQEGAEGALVDAVRKQKEAEAALAAAEKRAEERNREIGSLEGSAEEVLQSLMTLRREVLALRQQKDFLDAEVKGLGRARGAPWAEVLARVRAGLEHLQKELEKGRNALEDLRRGMERLEQERARAPAEPAESAPAPEAPGAPPAAGVRYSRLMQRLQQAAVGPVPEAPRPGLPAAPAFDLARVEAAIREVVEGLASLKAEVETMARTREALDAEVRRRESELRAAATLWALLADRGGADLRAAAESVVRASPGGGRAPVPPEFGERLREAARRLLQAEMVPAGRLKEMEREIEALHHQLETSVQKARFDALFREAEELRKRAAEAVPKWRVDAQEHEMKFLKKVAFGKGT